jgi:DNA modification methylase
MTYYTTVHENEGALLDSILNLHIKADTFDVDACFSKGNFYKRFKIPIPKLCFDIKPQVPNVIEANCEHLPLQDDSVKSIVFDPPFLATTGKHDATGKSNLIITRFGAYKNEIELHQFYCDALKEFYRLLKVGGKLVIKCQDKVSSGKQYFSHVFLHNEAVNLGFYPKDLFILVAKNRIIADWQRKNQQHARKYHCYYWVFEKKHVNLNYV